MTFCFCFPVYCYDYIIIITILILHFDVSFFLFVLLKEFPFSCLYISPCPRHATCQPDNIATSKVTHEFPSTHSALFTFATSQPPPLHHLFFYYKEQIYSLFSQHDRIKTFYFKHSFSNKYVN